LTIRMLLAVSESACLPGVVYYLSTFYTRGEIASRLGIFYAASSIAGAFGGLIAYGTGLQHEACTRLTPAIGVFQIHNSRLKNWQTLFLIEGCITILVAILMALFLPRSPATARFLSPSEKVAASDRLLKDASDELESKLEVRRAFRDLMRWQTFIWIAMEFCIGVPLASVSNFLPQIVARLVGLYENQSH
jgi:MFS family permease